MTRVNFQQNSDDSISMDNKIITSFIILTFNILELPMALLSLRQFLIIKSIIFTQWCNLLPVVSVCTEIKHVIPMCMAKRFVAI